MFKKIFNALKKNFTVNYGPPAGVARLFLLTSQRF